MQLQIIIPKDLVQYAKTQGIVDLQGFFFMYLESCLGIEQGVSLEMLENFLQKEENEDIIEDFK